MSADPDAAIVALFKHHARPNPLKSAEAGRPIYDDIEVVEIRGSGSRNYSVHPANAVSHWTDDGEMGQRQITYAERFRRQYEQFKAQTAQTKSGTPLEHVPFITAARRAELRALNIYTVEALATVDGFELKNLGVGGRELKNQAMEYIEESKNNVPSLMLQAEMEALRARNAILEEDNETLKARGSGEFDDMTLDQLRDYIAANTGHPPAGTLNRKTLLRMATDARPDRNVSEQVA